MQWLAIVSCGWNAASERDKSVSDQQHLGAADASAVIALAVGEDCCGGQVCCCAARGVTEQNHQRQE
jgi:hypothetical protein